MEKELKERFEKNIFLKMFDCVRIIDTSEKMVKKEYLRKEEALMPKFIFSEYEMEYIECKQLQRPVHLFKKYLDKVFFVVISPFDESEPRYVVESMIEVNKEYFSGPKVIMDMERLENAYKISNTDELTGTYNRRYFNRMISIALSNMEKKEQYFSLIFIDLDFFKEINDIYGHQVGDKILKELARLLLSTVRTPLDWVSRYGGDEFIVCVPNQQYKEAEIIAERIRKRIEKHVFEDEHGNPISLTCSIGLYTLDSRNPDYDQAMRSLDERLYCAKRTGKNKVVGEMSCEN